MKKIIVTVCYAAAALSACSPKQPHSRPELEAMRFSARFADEGSVVQDAQLRSYLERLVSRLYPAKDISVSIVGGVSRGAVVLPDGAVVLSLSLFQECTNEAELAFVLLHEIAHVNLGHESSSEHPRTYSEEVAADLWAVRRLAQLRWNPYAVEGLLEREAIRGAGGNSVELIGRLDEIRRELSGMPVGGYYTRNSDEFVVQQRRIIKGN